MHPMFLRFSASGDRVSWLRVGIQKLLFRSHQTFASDARHGLEPWAFAERCDVSGEVPGAPPVAVAVTEHAPAVFHQIRLLAGVSGARVAAAFAVDPVGTASRASLVEKSQGKSQAVFILSEDKRFLLKSLNDEELDQLMSMLAPYLGHLRANPDTLLPWFLGVFSIRAGSGTFHVVLMRNVFCTPDGARMDEQYDLKGSRLKRTVGERKINDIGVTYKDLDWQKFQHRMHLSARHRRWFLEQIDIDTTFLKACNVMDYSLLLGVRRDVAGRLRQDPRCGCLQSRRRPCRLLIALLQALCGGERGRRPAAAAAGIPRRRHKQTLGGIASSDGHDVYYMGIIDVLQRWNFRKKSETVLKRVRHVSIAAEPSFSCVDPTVYQRRLVRFMSSDVLGALTFSDPRPQLHPDPPPARRGSSGSDPPAKTAAAAAAGKPTGAGDALLPESEARGDGGERKDGAASRSRSI